MTPLNNVTWSEDEVRIFNDVGFCIQFGIVITGCITTPLIPVFLWRLNIGSKSKQNWPKIHGCFVSRSLFWESVPFSEQSDCGISLNHLNSASVNLIQEFITNSSQKVRQNLLCSGPFDYFCLSICMQHMPQSTTSSCNLI